jgi:hypothetical protein
MDFRDELPLDVDRQWWEDAMALHGGGCISGWRGESCHDGRWIISVSHDRDGVAAILSGQINRVLATYGGNGFSSLLFETQPSLDVRYAMCDHHLRHSNSSQQGAQLRRYGSPCIA